MCWIPCPSHAGICYNTTGLFTQYIVSFIYFGRKVKFYSMNLCLGSCELHKIMLMFFCHITVVNENILAFIQCCGCLRNLAYVKPSPVCRVGTNLWLNFRRHSFSGLFIVHFRFAYMVFLHGIASFQHFTLVSFLLGSHSHWESDHCSYNGTFKSGFLYLNRTNRWHPGIQFT